jgi:hypothetical protein
MTPRHVSVGLYGYIPIVRRTTRLNNAGGFAQTGLVTNLLTGRYVRLGFDARNIFRLLAI